MPSISRDLALFAGVVVEEVFPLHFSTWKVLMCSKINLLGSGKNVCSDGSRRTGGRKCVYCPYTINIIEYMKNH